MKRNLFILLLSLFCVGSSGAQIPRTISYQGDLRLSSGTPIADGSHVISLSIYNSATGGSPLYKENDLTNVKGGIFNCVIGALTPIPDWLSFDSAYFLGVSVDGSAELMPRTPFTSVPYALHAQVADGLTANAYIPPGLVIGSTAPSGPALGDLSGIYPYPKVVGLQSRPISSVLPFPGDLFTWNGTTWGPEPEPKPIAFHILWNANGSYTKTGKDLFDDGNFFDTSTGTSVIPKSGVYRFDINVSGSVNNYNYYTNVYPRVVLIVDGKDIGVQNFDASLTSPNGVSTSSFFVSYAELIKLTAGQIVKFGVGTIIDPTPNYMTLDIKVFRLN